MCELLSNSDDMKNICNRLCVQTHFLQGVASHYVLARFLLDFKMVLCGWLKGKTLSTAHIPVTMDIYNKSGTWMLNFEDCFYFCGSPFWCAHISDK